jgi:hypothetical protein
MSEYSTSETGKKGLISCGLLCLVLVNIPRHEGSANLENLKSSDGLADC